MAVVVVVTGGAIGVTTGGIIVVVVVGTVVVVVVVGTVVVVVVGTVVVTIWLSTRVSVISLPATMLTLLVVAWNPASEA